MSERKLVKTLPIRHNVRVSDRLYSLISFLFPCVRSIDNRYDVVMGEFDGDRVVACVAARPLSAPSERRARSSHSPPSAPQFRSAGKTGAVTTSASQPLGGQPREISPNPTNWFASFLFFASPQYRFSRSSWTVCVCDLFSISLRFRFVARCPPGHLAKFPTRASTAENRSLHLINQAELRSRVKIAPCQSIPTTTLYLHLDPLCRRPHGPHP